MSYGDRECCTYCNGNHNRLSCPHYAKDRATFKRGQRWLAVKAWFKNLVKPNKGVTVAPTPGGA